jgi:hypothetical protein
VKIFEQRGAARADAQRILIVRYRCALLSRELVVVDRTLMGFAPRSKLDCLVAVARARRPPYRLTERILRLPRNPHSTFAVRAPARVFQPRAELPKRALPAATGPARQEPSSIAARRCAIARAAAAVARAVHATLTGRAAVAAISSSTSQHGVRLPHRAAAARV